MEARYGLDLGGQEEQVLRALKGLCEAGMDRCLSMGLEELCDEVVKRLAVGETYFMRHREALEEFVRHLSAIGRPRVWCAACSSGEEVYSLAFLLVQRGVEDFSIVGSDINPSAVRRAMEGVYGLWSLRGLGDEKRLLLDHLQGERFRVKDRYRKNVRFLTGNVLSPPEGLFDGISCRNLFIYFSDSATCKALDIFHERLSPQGVLLVGAAEAPSVTRLRGTLFSPSGLFVFRKTAPTGEGRPTRNLEGGWRALQGEHHPVDGAQHPVLRSPNLINETPKPSTPKSSKEADAPKAVDKDEEDRVFYSIKSTADRGDLQGALALLALAEAENPTWAKIRFLKGVILTDMGMHKEAKEALKEAAYLDPDMPEARYSLMILSLKEGDVASAQRHGRLLLNSLKDMDDGKPTLYGSHIAVGHLRRAARELV
ncbi:MAG: hypothetical protein N2315_03335 [Thermanaerothrix sp.]|nr:hypothetical protein [Thermanaerothrix sp.]